MSQTSKVFFGASCVTAVVIIGYVHFKQSFDRRNRQSKRTQFEQAFRVRPVWTMLHQGVANDLAKQNMGKTQNTYMLQQQIDLTKKLKKQEDLATKSNPDSTVK